MSHRGRYAQYAVLLALVIVWAVPYARWYVDDTYIYLQFARNLVSGHGFSFNPGEITPAITGPLWVLLISAGEALTGGQLVVAKALSISAGIGAVFVFWALARRLLDTTWIVWLVTCLFAFDGWWSRTPYSGMESAAGTFFVLVILLLRVQESDRDFRGFPFSAVAAAIGTLVRPEIALLFLLSLAYRLLITRRLKGVLIEAAIAALVLLPYATYAIVTFGTVVPTTFYAKRDLLPWVQRLTPTALRIGTILAASQVLQIALAAAGALMAPKRVFGDRRTWLAWAWLFMLPLSYVLRGLGSLVSSRYLIMVSPLITLMAGLALEALVPLVSVRRRSLVLVAVVGALAVQAMWFQFAVIMPSSRRSITDFDDGWRQMALWIRENTPSDSAVAAGAIGIPGYFSERRIVDLGGLLDPTILGYESRSGVPFADYVRQLGADYLLVTEPPSTVNRSAALRLLHETTISAGSGLANAQPAEMRLYQIDWSAVE